MILTIIWKSILIFPNQADDIIARTGESNITILLKSTCTFCTCTFEQNCKKLNKFLCLHKPKEHWEQTICCEHERNGGCSFDKVCNSFVMRYWIGKAVLRIFQFYANQPKWIHGEVTIWWYPGLFHEKNMMIKWKVKFVIAHHIS